MFLPLTLNRQYLLGRYCTGERKSVCFRVITKILHFTKKRSFSLIIPSEMFPKCGLVTFTEEILNKKCIFCTVLNTAFVSTVQRKYFKGTLKYARNDIQGVISNLSNQQSVINISSLKILQLWYSTAVIIYVIRPLGCCPIIIYTNADLQIYRYLCLHIKIICRRFRIVTAFSFWVMRTRDIRNVCLQT